MELTEHKRVFDPWIGCMYNQKATQFPRLLILGESHYGRLRTEKATTTKDLITGIRCNLTREPFFTKVARLICLAYNGSIASAKINEAEVWQRVAFANYIQEFVSEGPRVRPTHEMWEKAAVPFIQTLHEIKPQILLVLGKQLGERLPPITQSEHLIEICRINHPSSGGWAYKRWSADLEKSFLVVANRKRGD